MLPDPEERPLLGAEESRHACGDVLGRSAWYAGLSTGEIPGAIRVGRRLFVRTADLREWVGVDGSTNCAVVE